MKREIKFTPAYDKRDPDPEKNYGISGANMCWHLIGEVGAVSFIVYTNWYLPNVQRELETKGVLSLLRPLPADVSYHSLKPMYEGQAKYNCDVLLNGKCYCDGSGLRAISLFQTLVEKGGDAVWKELEEMYVGYFGELK